MIIDRDAAVRRPQAETRREFRELFASLYNELFADAARNASRWSGMDTLDPSALLHETYLRLDGSSGLADPLRLKAAAGNVARHVLVDDLRRRRSAKRGGGMRRAALVGATDENDLTYLPDDTDVEAVLEVQDMLSRLRRENGRLYRIVECRIYGGMTVEETAKELQISPATVKRGWEAAKKWLRVAIV